MSDPSGHVCAAHDAVVERVLTRPGTVVLLGGSDTGKTTMARRVLGAALDASRDAVWVDTDLGQSTVGPPTTIGLRRIRGDADLEDPSGADELYFVGDTSPRGQFPALLAGTARLVASARRQADLVVVDTCGFVEGVAGQSLKYHQLELAQPDHVIGLQHDAELEPLLGVARRFTTAEVSALPVHPGVVPTSPEQRAENRRSRLQRYFDAPLHRFAVQPTTFMPPLPAGFDLSALHGMLVGWADGRGGFQGVGVLEHADGVLRSAGPVAQAPSGLRLGSARVDEAWHPRSVDLRGLLGSA